MMSPENKDLYEATCLTCNVSKSYFTAQGVNFFKTSHEGHEVKISGPDDKEPAEAVKEPPRVEAPPARVAIEQPKREQPVFQARASEPIRLGNLVVDVVEEDQGRAVMVYGIAGGRERFTKEFAISKVDELNSFLESGMYVDAPTGTTYTWSPDKIDLSIDVARIIESPAAAEPGVSQRVPAGTSQKRDPTVAKPAPKQEQKLVVPRKDEPQAPTEEMLLGKLSYIQPGEKYAEESVRVSKVLRKFRWNTEPPYVIGALFDDLVSVQSQSGMIKSSVIAAMGKIGYTFVAVEAPSAVVTAWFKKNDGEQADPVEEPLEFSAQQGA